MTHHQITEAKQSGISVLLAAHTNTERGYLPRLKEKLEDLCPGTDIMISEKDRDYIVVG